MMFVACGILLPTVLMRDLSILSYLSVFGIFAVRHRKHVTMHLRPEHPSQHTSACLGCSW